MIPVIMSGGSGTRLWPLSRKQKPKQFLPLVNNHTMFENTLLRLKGIADIEPPVVVCNEDHRFMVAEQLKELGIENSTIALEPVGRNTAPAIAAAAFAALENNPDSDPLLLVLAADHEITQVPAFHAAIAATMIQKQKHYQGCRFGSPARQTLQVTTGPLNTIACRR